MIVIKNNRFLARNNTQTKMNPMPKIIAISGIDGSGKSTQLHLLERELKKRGIKFKKVWLRWPAFLSYPFLTICRIFGYTEWEKNSRSGTEYAERKFYKNLAIAKLWPWFLCIDTLIYVIFHVNIPARFGYSILCDRHVLDILIDLICDTRDYSLFTSLPARLLFSLLPNSSLVLDLEELKAYRRKQDVPNIQYLKKRRNLYLKIARKLCIPIIDGRRNSLEVHQELMKILNNSNKW